jgi:nucleotide-binding universal stress UspA family protein
MYERLLIPTDGSDVAAAAANVALTLADRFDANLHAVSVREPTDRSEATDPPDRALRTITDRAVDADVEATTAVLDDDDPVHRVVLDYVDRHDVDCVVMGTHGRTGIDRFVLGSVAEQTLREAPVPVVTVHEDTVLDPDFGTVLVPTDGSDCASTAADHAIDLAVATNGAVHIIHVVDLGVVWDDVTAGTVLEALEDAGERAIDEVVDRAENAGVGTVEASVVSGTPYHAIVEYVDERDVDCVVMGTHGRTGLSRYLLGSVTERVVRLTDVPVVGIKTETTAARARVDLDADVDADPDD